MSFVAARTERVHIAGNVLSLPLRQPAVLARAAASLTCSAAVASSSGLGAGGFWDPIVGMGGERLSPGESLRALGEAIDVIRGIWDKGNHERLVVDGTHHRVSGAKRGPAPATSRSGSAASGRACCGSSARRRMAGCPRSRT